MDIEFLKFLFFKLLFNKFQIFLYTTKTNILKILSKFNFFCWFLVYTIEKYKFNQSVWLMILTADNRRSQLLLTPWHELTISQKRTYTRLQLVLWFVALLLLLLMALIGNSSSSISDSSADALLNEVFRRLMHQVALCCFFC